MIREKDKLQNNPELNALCWPDWRKQLKASSADDDLKEFLRVLAHACRKRAALKSALADDERKWLREMLAACEAAKREIKALIEPEMASEVEVLKMRSDYLRTKGRRLLGDGH